MNKAKEIVLDVFRLKGLTLRKMPLLLAISIALIVLYLKSIDTNLTNFYERAIGHASINGVDAPVRVTAFWTSLAILAISLLAGSYIIDRVQDYLRRKLPESAYRLEATLFFEMGILWLINELVFLYQFVFDRTAKMSPYILVAFAVVCLHSLISLYLAHKNLLAETPLKSVLGFLLPIPLTYFILLVTSLGSQTITVVSIKTIVIFLGLYIASRILLTNILCPIAAAFALIPLSFLPVTYIIGNEIQYTLTKHGVVASPKVLSVGMSVALIAAAILIYWRKRGTHDEMPAMKVIENIIVPVLLVTLGMFSTHAQVIEGNFDLLHNGNKTLPVQQLFQFGNFPFLDIWPHQHLPILSYLYVLLNGLNFLEPNIWLGMSRIIVNIIVCYFVVKQFFNSRWTALLLLFSPIMAYANTYYLTGLLPLVYLKSMRKNRRAIDYAIFFGLALVAFVYQSSSGKIAVIASLVIIALSCSTKKEWISAGKGVLITAAVPCFIYAAYVLFQGENLFDRIALIQALGDSDILVGSRTIIVRDRTPFEIITYYGLFPLLGAVIAFFALRAKDKSDANYGVVFIVVACVISSLRSLARHSLVEGLQTDFYPLLLVIAPYVLIKNVKIKKLVASSVIAALLITPYVNTEYGIAADGVKDFSYRQFDIGEVRCDTVNSPSYPKNLRKVLDTVLTKDQTFFETINAYLLYALMERDCTFLDSSTLLIQYERPQVAYLHTLEKLYEQNKVPIIITGYAEKGSPAIDDIPSELSLFKLEEWIYAHYEPWIWVDGFHLWRAKNSGINLEAVELAKVPFLEDNIDSVKHLTYSIHDDAIVLDCKQGDPLISLPLQEPITASAETTQLKIEYRTSVPGSLQVFYDYTGYSEKDSVRINVPVTEDFRTAYISIPEPETSQTLKKVRIDPPEGALFEVRSLSLVEQVSSIEYQIKDYIQQDFNMLKLPYVWGNYDEKVNEQFPEEQLRVAGNLSLDADVPETLSLDADVDKSSGNYIYFRVNAAEAGTLILRYGDNIINSCNFDVVEGEWDYLVRISTQYNWVNERQSAIEIMSTVPVEIKQVSVLKGD